MCLLVEVWSPLSFGTVCKDRVGRNLGMQPPPATVSVVPDTGVEGGSRGRPLRF